MAEEQTQAVETNLSREAGEEAVDWLRRIRSNQSLKVAIARTYPTSWKGKNIKGHIETIEELPEDFEDYLKERYGGGKYQVKVQRPNSKGGYSYGGAATIEVAGNPNLQHIFEMEDDTEDGKSNGKSAFFGESDDLAKAALGMAERSSREERERADRAEERLLDRLAREEEEKHNTRPDPMLDILREELREARAEIREMRNKPPEKNDFQERILLSMTDGKQGEINSIRTQHEAELRMLREHHAEEIRRKDDRYERELSFLREDHKRAISSLENAYEGRIQTIQASKQSEIALLQAQLARYEGELGSTKTELTNLRSQKETSPLDMIQMMVGMKEGLSQLSGDEDDRATWEKILDKVSEMGSPLLQGMMLRGQQQAQLQAPQTPSANVENNQNPVQAQPITPEKQKELQEELAKAFTFIETAIGNNTPVEKFVMTAQKLVSPEILDTIIKAGPDQIIEFAAEQNPGSPITTMEGRAFIRQAIAMLKGEDESTEDNNTEE